MNKNSKSKKFLNLKNKCFLFKQKNTIIYSKVENCISKQKKAETMFKSDKFGGNFSTYLLSLLKSIN